MSLADGSPALQPDLVTLAPDMPGVYMEVCAQLALDDATRVMAVSTTHDPSQSSRVSDQVRLIFPDGTMGSTTGLAGVGEPTNTSILEGDSTYSAQALAMKARGGTLYLLQPLWFDGVHGAMLRRYPLPSGPVALLAFYATCSGGPLAVDSAHGVALVAGTDVLHASAADYTATSTLFSIAGTPLGMDYDAADTLWLISKEDGVGYHLYSYDTSMTLVATVADGWDPPPGGTAIPDDIPLLHDGPLASAQFSGVADLCIDRLRGALYLLDVDLAPTLAVVIDRALPGALRRLDLGTLEIATVAGGALYSATDALVDDLLPGAARGGAAGHRFGGGRSVTCGPDGAVYWSQGLYELAHDTIGYHQHYSFIFRAGCP